MKEKIKCNSCGGSYSPNNIEKHIGSNACKNKIRKLTQDPIQIADIAFKCPFCDKTGSKHSVTSHIWRGHTEEGKQKHNPNIGYLTGNRIVWNKGLTAKTDERVKRNTESLKEGFKTGKNIPWPLGLAGDLRLSKNHPKPVFIPFIDSFGTAVTLRSKYELKVAEELNANQIQWAKPKTFKYTDKLGNKRTYIPDFYLPLYDVYLDPKNEYLIIKDLTKISKVIEENKIKILILRYNQLTWETISSLLKLKQILI